MIRALRDPKVYKGLFGGGRNRKITFSKVEDRIRLAGIVNKHQPNINWSQVTQSFLGVGPRQHQIIHVKNYWGKNKESLSKHFKSTGNIMQTVVQSTTAIDTDDDMMGPSKLEKTNCYKENVYSTLEGFDNFSTIGSTNETMNMISKSKINPNLECICKLVHNRATVSINQNCEQYVTNSMKNRVNQDMLNEITRLIKESNPYCCFRFK